MEVDDYLPVNILTHKPLFPVTASDEFWPQLIGKALMKFFSFKYYQLLNKQSSTLTKESTLYNGDISTALVNLYSINYSLDQIESFNWDYLKSLFSDQENERNSYITFLYK